MAPLRYISLELPCGATIERDEDEFSLRGGTQNVRIAPLMQAMRVLERLFGCNFDDRVHFCQNIIGQMAFDLMAPGQFSDAGHLGFT